MRTSNTLRRTSFSCRSVERLQQHAAATQIDTQAICVTMQHKNQIWSWATYKSTFSLSFALSLSLAVSCPLLRTCLLSFDYLSVSWRPVHRPRSECTWYVSGHFKTLESQHGLNVLKWYCKFVAHKGVKQESMQISVMYLHDLQTCVTWDIKYIHIYDMYNSMGLCIYMHDLS